MFPLVLPPPALDTFPTQARQTKVPPLIPKPVAGARVLSFDVFLEL